MKHSHLVLKSILIVLVCNSASCEISRSNQRLNKRQEKVLAFFGVGLVRFENSECIGSGSMQGTCYTRRQCREIDGIGSTKCAGVQRTCGETSSLNNTYFVSPGFPSAYTGSSVCTITIQKCAGVCQIRLDFLTLRLAQPNGNGTCTTDALLVTGGASIVPAICGENTGQHIYVDFNGDTPITISVSTSGTTSAAVAWNIKVTQIGCNCPTRAPSGCLQYFNSTTGTVRGFNYGNSINQNGTRQLANLNYGVCIAMIPGTKYKFKNERKLVYVVFRGVGLVFKEICY
ncbi:unnamed protein product [Acanthoscelides obtectus]|uniref:CUB domain-containing protein n=1 Tax=Acanthoscelides obtectus TaxID=200917 RepID=A0A9P0JYM5_ACAOB|nr:unnamed protein product [Acanthoscelides obtectus]CAK1652954.1 hypothetical protein AOBTE_LOCUS17985 [Acanthoscelides obtectus]